MHMHDAVARELVEAGADVNAKDAVRGARRDACPAQRSRRGMLALTTVRSWGGYGRGLL